MIVGKSLASDNQRPQGISVALSVAFQQRQAGYSYPPPGNKAPSQCCLLSFVSVCLEYQQQRAANQ